MKNDCYSARITTKTPSAFLFMIDQSGSMSENTLLNGTKCSKAEAVSMLINSMIDELLARCKRQEGYKDYLHFVFLGYCGNQVESLLTGDQGGCTFLTPTQLSAMTIPSRTIDVERQLPTGERVVSSFRQKQWIVPKSFHTTPMKLAFEKILSLCKQWSDQYANQDCFPPTVIHITDGEATDGSDQELIDLADKIKRIGTLDGTIQLFNIHISSNIDTQSVSFPATKEELPSERYAELLFSMSSTIPKSYHEQIERSLNKKIDSRGVKALSYNADMSDLIKMINIGSISINFIR